jgi:hypothetical protein
MHPKAVLARDWLLTLGPSGAWSQKSFRAVCLCLLQRACRADSNLKEKRPTSD